MKKRIYRYLINRNKQLEEELKKYKNSEKQVERLSSELSALEKEWKSKVEALERTQSEYTDLIREVKIIKRELLRVSKRKGDSG